MFKVELVKAGLIFSFFAFSGTAIATEYQIDTSHSTVSFKVRHLGISTVTGSFEKFGGTFSVDPKNIKATKGSASIDVGSINTFSPKRDGHLKGDDFFDAAHFPNITFVSKEVKDINEKDSTCTLVGDLTLHGTTKEIFLKVKGGGILGEGTAKERAAFMATGKINRFDFGLKWSKAIETGALVASAEVELMLSFEGTRKPDPEKPAK
jgi:polyisoprenoid-binding protein YceI